MTRQRSPATCRGDDCDAPLLASEAVCGRGLCAACDPERSADSLVECPVCGKLGEHSRIRRQLCHDTDHILEL